MHKHIMKTHLNPWCTETQAARQLLHHVPYSLHSSFSELAAFVGRLRPRAVRGIVKGSSRTGYPTGGGAQAVSVADAIAVAASHRWVWQECSAAIAQMPSLQDHDKAVSC